MATVQVRNDSSRVLFCFRGKHHTYTIGKVTAKEAGLVSANVDRILLRLEQGLLALPVGLDIVTFIQNDGKTPEAEKAGPGKVHLGKLTTDYQAANSIGAMEENSLDTVRMHLRHFESSLGEQFDVQSLMLHDLQKHVERRAKKKYRGHLLSPVTLRKEMASFRAMWNWAVHGGRLKGLFPSRGLKYPKGDEKPPFQAWEEIERRIGRNGPKKEQNEGLWDCLYLRSKEIEEVLLFVKDHGTQQWVYPLICTAAHTGARRSELLRLEVDDVDFAGDTILVREKKRMKGQRTTRRVTLTLFLKQVLGQWIKEHPGGNRLFAQAILVPRSKTKRSVPEPVTRDEAHDHFKRTLSGGKWAVIRGFHCFRHSFISCLAAKGVDQRIIDDFVGHQTEEQRRRYRHLYPDVKQEALRSVFG